MGKYYYSKSGDKLKRNLRLISILCVIIGVALISYVLFPILSWQIYFNPTFASQNITSSIPHANIIDLAKNSINRIDYTKAENWFPGFNPTEGSGHVQTPFYTISIPSIKIENAEVSTVDTNLKKHLVNYQGTSIPGQNGNAAIFGHSTLPQLFNAKDYKTIFANAYKIRNDDVIYAMVNGVTYTYRVFNIKVVDPDDSSALSQNYNDSYLTLVTCTPPGTIWKRLVVKARLIKI